MSPAIFTSEETPSATPQPTGPQEPPIPDAVVSTSSSTNGASDSSANQNISSSPAVSSLNRKMNIPAEPPLASGPLLFCSPSVQDQNSVETVAGDDHT